MKIHHCLSESHIKSRGLPTDLGYLGQQWYDLWKMAPDTFILPHLILFEASRSRGAILGINILPDPVMRRAHPPAAHVEE